MSNMKNMNPKQPQQVIEEMEKARQKTGTLIMDLDGAQTNLIIESLYQSLLITTRLFETTKNIDPESWSDGIDDYNFTIKSTRELSLTLIETMQNFVEALPQDLRELTTQINMTILEQTKNILIDKNV